MAHQMANHLKSGEYTLGTGAKPLSFGRVALVGHSAAGGMVELDAASYKDVDAIGEVSFNDSGFTPLTLTQLGAQNVTCLSGAQYAPFGATDADFTTAHLNAPTDPKVAAAVLKMRNPEPCGDAVSATGAVAALQAGAESVGAIPVLDIIGDEDHVFDPNNEALQASRLAAGGATVTKVIVQSASHGITLGLSHDAFTGALSKWLTDNGF
jgi:dienelactone hydrolase